MRYFNINQQACKSYQLKTDLILAAIGLASTLFLGILYCVYRNQVFQGLTLLVFFLFFTFVSYGFVNRSELKTARLWFDPAGLLHFSMGRFVYLIWPKSYKVDAESITVYGSGYYFFSGHGENRDEIMIPRVLSDEAEFLSCLPSAS